MCHDLMHRYKPQFCEVMVDFVRREALYTSMYRFTSTVVVDLSLGRKQFIESYGKSAKKIPRICILPFVNFRRKLSKEQFDLFNRKNYFPEKFIFYPAQFWPHKNHMNLLKAINSLKDEIKDIKLILVGSEKWISQSKGIHRKK